MAKEFVHLHLHSDFSLLDGACSVEGVAETAASMDMTAVAITDHGFMGGAMDFYTTLGEKGVKPIIGCEFYISPTTRFDRDQSKDNIKGFHLVLLAKDFEGYSNLCRLISAGFIEGFYHNPRIDNELLSRHSKGLIALSACLKGKIQDCILADRLKDAKDAVGDYLDIFGRGNFYLELMDHGIPEQRKANKAVVMLSREFDIPLVATNDVHYLKREHAKAHELMLCIQTRSTMESDKRFRFSSDQFYFRSPEEMAELFADTPEAISNTIEVAEKCNLVIPMAPEVNHYPVFDVPEGISRKDYLRNICVRRMKECYGFAPEDSLDLTPGQKEIVDRMDFELKVIDGANYTSYFLVVWDFIKYAREQGIAVGPGRGSGAGSIVAYLSSITEVDPIRYNLLFERFLNPDRVSPPDFDIDFCERRRPEVIEYVRERYGREKVAQIGTYGTLKAKAVIKDIVRVMGRSFQDGDSITRHIPDRRPDGKSGNMTLDLVKQMIPEIKEMLEKEAWVREVFEYAKVLENLNRNLTTHAAGVIIGDQSLDNLVPLCKDSNGEIITQYAGKPCESLGLLKMDFLALSNLTIIQDTIVNIKANRGEAIDITKVSLDDSKTFDLITRGDTVAVFQLESSGMRKLCRSFGMSCFEDIIALIAIYRPGPMNYLDEFVARKLGKVPVEYDHPVLEGILKETCGIMLYQEQIMQMVQTLAGFTLGQADILRRAISKKDVKTMHAQHEKFTEGCSRIHGIVKAASDAIWEKIAKFAGYGFNKSHSAAYAFVAYRTAFLKANYPVEFMAAVLSSNLDKADKIASGIRECREMGISVLPPDVNVSQISFTVDGDSIRFGLGAIKGVGETAASAMIKAREENGKFKDLLSFCELVGSTVNSRILENLTLTGAFDSFGLRRAQILAVMDQAVSLAQSLIKDRSSGQGSLFDMLPDGEDAGMDKLDIPDMPEIPEHELLEKEKALLGFYVTGHPLGEYADIIKSYSSHSLVEVTNRESENFPSDGSGVKVGGIITACEKKQAKSGKHFAVFQVEDLEGTCECVILGQSYESYNTLLMENAPVYLEAFAECGEQNSKPKLRVEKIIPLGMVREMYTKEVHIKIHEGGARKDMIEELRKICKAHPGKTCLVFCLTCSTGEVAFIESAREFDVSLNKAFLAEVAAVIGENKLHFRPDKELPQRKMNHWEKKNS
ncbi:MAG: DNA polymerase III subunit alpha [Victivallales bacterium]|nr:DNA polymerase III subunit alpha [Victivallales bacterium]